MNISFLNAYLKYLSIYFQLECTGFKRILPRVLPDAARLLAKLIRKLSCGGGFIRGYYTEKSYRIWKDLMSRTISINLE